MFACECVYYTCVYLNYKQQSPIFEHQISFLSLDSNNISLHFAHNANTYNGI